MKVWIDQDLCTGDGLCEEIAPAVFTLLDDGLAYVKDGDKVLSDPGGAEAIAPVPAGPGRGHHRVGRGVPRRVHLHRGRVATCRRTAATDPSDGASGPHRRVRAPLRAGGTLPAVTGRRTRSSGGPPWPPAASCRALMPGRGSSRSS